MAGMLIMLMLSSCKKTLFQRLPAGKTGVTFANRAKSTKDRNVLNHYNLYNGGGVAVADFNNDGREDLYFTGSSVNNKLYLNQGSFRFKDVTKEAKVAGENKWSSGVAAVDINNDGLMDLYVCATESDNPKKRANLFYINQGVNKDNVPVFKNMASAFNLADSTYTTMAAFFDYDNDGDLDLYLLVNKYNSDRTDYHKKKIHGESPSTDRLYRNDGADSTGTLHFTDVSDQAGIVLEGFGLGVNISDFNMDGWKDIYVANDFVTDDIIYINNGDGTFTDEAAKMFKHTSDAAMGNNVRDINNDGHPDVITLDMMPEGNYRKKKVLYPNNYMNYVNNKRYNYNYHYVRNQLQVFQGINPKTKLPLYSEIGIYSGVSATDWSWDPLVSDFDNDGWRDIYITNGFPKDTRDHDFESYANQFYPYVSMDKLLSKIPSVKISNYAYKNNGDLTFKNEAESWGLQQSSYSYGAVQADLDNDGDLDLVVNNLNDSAFVYKNNLEELNKKNDHYLRVNFKGKGDNIMGLGASLKIKYGNGKKQYYEHTIYRGYLSSVEPTAHFGLGSYKTVDTLLVTWPDSSSQLIRNIKADQTLTLDWDNATKKTRMKSKPDSVDSSHLFSADISQDLGINYVHKDEDYNDFNRQPLLPHKLSQYGPGLAIGDVNGDGLEDMYISGSYGRKGTFFIQQKDGTFNRKDLIEGNNPKNKEEELGSLFFDADGDGDQDLYIVSGGDELKPGSQAYQDRLFINENGTFRLDAKALPNFISSGSAVRAADFDKDGDLDLFVGGRVKPRQYSKPVNSYLLENVSSGKKVRFKIVNANKAPMLNDIGMVSDALWTDFNNDGWTDLILAGEWMPLTFLKNNHGTFQDVTGTTGISDNKGWWNSLCAGDFDNDGDVDYIAGNLGTNTYFKASDKYPVHIYGNDFDHNGTYDAIPTVYYKNSEGEKVEVPYFGRRDMIKQIPGIKNKFQTYDSFAKANIDEILSHFDTDSMATYEANDMKTSYIENLGKGKFKIRSLPENVQWAPVFGCQAQDLNNDENLDFALVGNDYGNEISTGRYDALNGLVLTGKGNGTFNSLNFEKSGFFVPGNAKALAKLRGASGSVLLAASQNKGPLKVFRQKNKMKLISLKPMDAYAVLHFKDGTSRKQEFYYGSSFLSASGRFMEISKKVHSVVITDYQGDSRTVTFN